MSNKGKDKRKVARGATLFTGKRLITGKKVKTPKKAENKKSKKIFDKSRLFDKDALPIYHSAPDPGWEDKVINHLGHNGIEVSSYKKRYLIRRIRVRMGRLKLNSYQEYNTHITQNPSEIRELQESLSINVTRFFRNRDTYELLKNEILPQIIRDLRNHKHKEVKIWSAGCAVGAEPYSIAMICSDIIPQDMRVNIQATDIKNDLLRIARNGVYSEAYLAELNEAEIMKYFSHNHKDEFEIKRRIKRMVSFMKHDLMKQDFPSNLDLITCRNVLIYIDRQAQQEIISKFFDALKPGGILILGRTETLFGEWRKHVDIISTKHRVYQKKSSIRQQITFAKSIDKLIPKQKISIKSHKNRLKDLKNFREIYEERRKAWNERIHQQQKQKREKIKKEPDNRFRIKQRSSMTGLRTRKHINSTSILRSHINPNERPIKKIQKSEFRKKGTLSNYRKRLKKTQLPIRIAQVRRDLTSEVEKMNLLDMTPEKAYQKLRERRKRLLKKK